MRKFIPLVSFALVLGGASFALADKDEHGGHSDHHPMPSAAASGVAHAAASSAVAAAAASGSAGTATATAKVDDDGATDDEKPEQKEKRHGYFRDEAKKLGDAVHANGKQTTDEEKEIVRAHWQRAMRLFRIRHLAMLDNDKAVVARVDAILARLDRQTEGKLKELNGKAPAAAGAASGAPATSAAPAEKKEGAK